MSCKTKLVVDVRKNGKVKVKDAALWREFVSRLKARISDAGDGVELFGESGACDDACEEHEGVDVCGESFVICNDGKVYLINP